MMKHIIIELILFNVCFCLLFSANAQVDDSIQVGGLVDKDVVNEAFRSVDVNDLSNGISIFNPKKYLDKSYNTYPLEDISAFIGGPNLWGLGKRLVLIDGVERDVNDVTSSEIDQIAFLKGANAIVLYGARAADGVILITTKKGHKGAKSINVRARSGISSPKAYPKYLGTADYMKYYNQALINDGSEAIYTDEDIANYNSNTNPYRYKDVDFYSSDYLRNFYNTNSVNVDFAGGNERAQFYVFTGFENSNSLIDIGENSNANNSRLNIRGKVNLELNDYISTYVDISTIFRSDKAANGDYWNDAATIKPNKIAPLIPLDAIQVGATNSGLAFASNNVVDGKYLLGGSSEFVTTPFGDAYASGHRTNIQRQFQYTAGVDIDLRNVLDGLSFHGQIGIDYSTSYKQSVDNGYEVFEATWETFSSGDSITSLKRHGEFSKNGYQNLSEEWNDQSKEAFVHVDYNNTFDEKHNVSAMLLANASSRREVDVFQYYTNSNLGLLLDYNYKHRYYVNFSAAVVNSTKLPKNTRVAFSPTLGIGWLMSEEDFLKDGFFDRLKLTATGGIINTDLDFDEFYMYQGIYGKQAYFSWADGTYTNQSTNLQHGENNNLDYVKRKELSFGMEASMFENKFGLKANAFFVKREGLPSQPYNTEYPSYFRTGYPVSSIAPYVNYGENSYKGFDFQVSYADQIGEVRFIVGAAGTYLKTKVLKEDEFYIDDYRKRTGQPVDAIFGLVSDGFFSSDEDAANSLVQDFAGERKGGDIKYVNQNGDDVIDSRDEVMLGTWGSPLSLGVHVTFEWKNFSLFALGTGRFGGTGIKNGDYYWVYGDKKYSEVVLNSWTEETKNTATYPRLTTQTGDNNYRTSDFWTYSTDRFDLAKVQLTYKLPESVLKDSFVKGFNVFVSGANLLTIAKNKDVMELNVGTVPQTRFYNLGIKAVF
nr:SusC/RagA family TonB-linked outer membrane protein [uncultured Draconibacterium sp.]